VNRNPVGQREKTIIYKKYNGHCAYCGKSITREEMRLAWHIPGKDGGTCSLFNLQPACISCSMYKRDKSVEEFRKFIDSTPILLQKKFAMYRLCVYLGGIEEKDTRTKFYFEISKKEKEEFHE